MASARNVLVVLAFAVVAATVVACGRAAPAAPRTASTPVGDASASLPARPASGSAGTAGDWLEFGYDPARTDDAPSATGIVAGNVGQLRRRVVRLPGIADSSAIVVNGVRTRQGQTDLAIVTTSYGKTIAVNARTGRRIWSYRPAGVDDRPGNPQVTTASPIADRQDDAVYAATPAGRIVRLALPTGRLMWSRSITFDPRHEKIASALNLDGSDVVADTGGYDGDIPPYDGHVVTLSRATGRIVDVWNSECSGQHRLIAADSCAVTATRGDDAMWGRAGVVIVPGSHDLLTATGNGPFDGHGD